VQVDYIAIRQEGITREVASEKEVENTEMEIVPDQVDLLCEIHPQYGVAGKRTKSQIVAAWPGV
jgi:REP element-mobilizing transposase RayT